MKETNRILAEKMLVEFAKKQTVESKMTSDGKVILPKEDYYEGDDIYDDVYGEEA